MDFEKMGKKVAAEAEAPLPTWSVIQHDGKGGIITVTPNVSAPDAVQAIDVVKNMNRRHGGPFGKAVVIRTEDLKRISEGY